MLNLIKCQLKSEIKSKIKIRNLTTFEFIEMPPLGMKFFSKTPLVGEAPVIFFSKCFVATDRRTDGRRSHKNSYPGQTKNCK